MSAVLEGSRPAWLHHARPDRSAALSDPPARVALLGTGVVGRALLERLRTFAGTPLATRLALVLVGNSRDVRRDDRGLHPGALHWQQALISASARSGVDPGIDLDAIAPSLREGSVHAILIDATASDAVAQRHAGWLAEGIHVVTASKLARGGSLARWHAIEDARREGGTCYGDAATVGAGLPLLQSVRRLRAGGDRIHAMAGVLSGSLAWLFDRWDGEQSFAELLHEARAAGYTEPDVREDLRGEDARRKLLILARAAGVMLEPGDIDVESLLPDRLERVACHEVDALLGLLDAPLRARFAAARAQGRVLRFVARLEGDVARIGLESVARTDPLAGGSGTDNRVALWSDRYRDQPMVIQGPGAGAGVTAAALLDDALRIASRGR